MIVAAPVVGRRLEIAGRGRTASYGEDDGFVAVLSLEPPVLPNGAQVGRLPAVGDEVVVRGDAVWDPTLRLVDPPEVGPPDDDDLAAAVASRDPTLAAAAGARLIGRGGGLTPEGDDLVCGVAAVIAVAGWDEAVREAWLAALIGGDLCRRTTALSATLLELAARGMGPEPLQAGGAAPRGARPRPPPRAPAPGRAGARGAAVGLSTVGMRR